MPKVSVVTVVLNDSQGLRLTLESVVRQSATDYEIIVIDGGSRDGTLGVIEDYGGHISKHVSEPDDGIYDAMLKGLDLAGGEWIIFMNAGDEFAHPHVLSSFAPPDWADLAYGQTRAKYPSGDVLWPTKPISHLWRGVPFSHQSLFCKRTVLEELRFRTDLKIVSDYDFYVRAVQRGYKLYNLNFAVARVETKGVSHRSFYSRTLERLPIAKRAFPNEPVLRYYTKLLAGKALSDLRQIFS